MPVLSKHIVFKLHDSTVFSGSVHNTFWCFKRARAKLYATLKNIGKVGGKEKPKKSTNLIPTIKSDTFLDLTNPKVAK